MMIDASVGTLFATLREKLDLHWTAGRTGQSRSIKNPESGAARTALVGHLNLIHPNRVQVLGKTEIQYLERLNQNARRELIDNLFDGTSDLIVIGDACPAPEDINQDGPVDAVDVQLVINGALDIDIGGRDADVNGDGSVNAVDVQIVINAVLGQTSPV